MLISKESKTSNFSDQTTRWKESMQPKQGEHVMCICDICARSTALQIYRYAYVSMEYTNCNCMRCRNNADKCQHLLIKRFFPQISKHRTIIRNRVLWHVKSTVQFSLRKIARKWNPYIYIYIYILNPNESMLLSMDVRVLSWTSRKYRSTEWKS